MQSTELSHTRIKPMYHLTDPFPVGRYRFVFNVYKQIILPGYAGSAIRGVFGHALRKASCITGLKQCNDCGLKKTCPYTGLFEIGVRQQYHSGMTTTATNPYVIEAPWDSKREYKPSERYEFSIVLVGPALKQLALCIHAMRQAFGRGIGPASGKASLVEVIDHNSDSIIWSAEEPELVKHNAHIDPGENCAAPGKHCLIKIETPLRIGSNGKLLDKSDLGATEFLTATVRRVAALVEGNMDMVLSTDYSGLRQQSLQLSCKTDLRWREWERFSGRQKQSMSAGGVIGHIELSGELESFLPFLQIASYVHIGKMTSFGNGKIQLTVD